MLTRRAADREVGELAPREAKSFGLTIADPKVAGREMADRAGDSHPTLAERVLLQRLAGAGQALARRFHDEGPKSRQLTTMLHQQPDHRCRRCFVAFGRTLSPHRSLLTWTERRGR